MKTAQTLGFSILLAWTAAGQEIGYVETFSLATNREAALRELVPGTDEYFYYHALQAQNSGERERFRETIDRWTRDRNGTVVDAARELLNRQALLDYAKEPSNTLAYLRRELNLHFDHARRTGERRSDAPTALDPSRIRTETLLQRALSLDPNHLERVEDAGLETVAARPITADQRRNLLARLRRPDYPGLVELVAADLAYRDSQGFGQHEIHRRLTLDQLNLLLQKMPELRSQKPFVAAYLVRLAPEDEVDLDTDAAARQAYYERVWAFVSTLDAAHNSLKANVLFNRLRHDRRQGVYDRARFLEYLKLPREVYYLRDEIRARLPRGDHMAQLNENFGLVALPPVADEEPLVRDFLLRLLAEAPDYEELRPWLRDDFLKRIFAEAKIVNGIGDPQQWAALLAPEDYKRLKERVDVDFAPDNPDVIGTAAPVALSAFVKNVPVLLVKVYEINTVNYYRKTGQPLNLAINLDGLVASATRRIEYPDAPERRVLRRFDFPELKARGAYVVELIGNGKSSRALVQKGSLGALQEVTAAGQAFAVLDEDGRRLPEARAWLAGREFVPGADGRIVIPFSAEPRPDRLVVSHAGFAAVVRFDHLAEAYALRAGAYVDREALIRREKAAVVLRPVLWVNGRPASLKLLEEPRLVLRTVDLRGIVTEKEVAGLELREDREVVSEIAVPENTLSLTVTLKARIRNISRNEKQDLADSAAFALNGMERTLAVQDLYVGRAADGYYVELRGKNGEARAGEPLACYFKHRFFRDEVDVQLQTDAQGRARLGALEEIERFRVREPAGAEHTWFPTRGACLYPEALQGRAGEPLRLPLVFERPDPLAEVSLLEVRAGQFVKDWHAALSLEPGFLVLDDLPAGDYSLFLKPEGREIAVRLTAGENRDGFTWSARRALERPRLAPLQVSAVEIAADAVALRLTNASPFARVHVFASRYLPAYDVFDRLGLAGTPPLVQQPWPPARTFYESGRDIGDEYRYVLDRQQARRRPGNMLERPALLLNPWALRDTEAEAEALARAGLYASRAAAERGVAGEAFGVQAADGASPEGYAALDFLRQPGVALLNLVPDKDGWIRISRADLQGKPHLRVLAVDPTTTVLRQIALEDTPLETRELRLADGLDPARTCCEQKIITLLPEQGGAEIADATTASFRAYDSVAEAYRLLATLAPNPTFEEFSFVARWPDLDAKEKRRLYSKYACHELNFFLQRKDPEFFRAVIAPNLKNKKDKTFLDRWLLEEDLKGYLEPWRFGRLNAAERALLGRRLREQAAPVARDARERADLIPPDLEDFNRRFDTALATGALEAGGAIDKQIDGVRQQRLKEAQLLLNDAMPAAAPAGAAPEAPQPTLGAARVRKLARALNQPKAALGMDAATEEKKAEELFFADDSGGRAEQRRFFQKLDRTQEWAENNYYHLPIEQQVADLIPASEFWADYAAHDGAVPFLSKNFPQATRNFTEMMLALAALDLPFRAAAHAEKLEGLRYTLRAASPLLLFHREIREAPRAEEAGAVLVAQHFFRADDRFRHENNEQYDKYVTEEFLPHVVYGAQVVLTNPTGNRQRLQVLLQIPRGALPVNSGFYTRGVYLALEPYSTQRLEYDFYFPATGKYAHYPVTLARNDRVVAAAPPFVFNVVENLTQVDKTSWAWISQNGSPEAVLAFLGEANLYRLDLNEIAWRMRDRAYFRQALALLEARRVYQDVLWSYGVLHNEPGAIREFLRHSPFASRCGLYLQSPLLALDPVERFDYQHLEYAPLVNPRVHPVGAKRKILNNRFREQYQRYMKVLSYKPAPGDADELAVAYYLALQDRVDEAMDWFGRVERGAVAEQLQYDYMEAFLAFSRGDVKAARRIAATHAGEGVDRWRDRFAVVLAQADEIEGGKAAAAVDKESRDQAQGALAATEPALELQVEAGKIRLDYRNLESCTLNFYPMDIELLFSRSPFLQEGAADFSFIRPVLTRAVALPAGRDSLVLELPKEFSAKNVMVEAVAAGATKTQAFYANTLKVHLIEAYGQLAVTHAGTHQPVSGAYVKVYARMAGGEVRFFKDGYTDLRGRFDYASLNSNELEAAERLAVLVLSDECGALVREAQPPKR